VNVYLDVAASLGDTGRVTQKNSAEFALWGALGVS